MYCVTIACKTGVGCVAFKNAILGRSILALECFVWERKCHCDSSIMIVLKELLNWKCTISVTMSVVCYVILLYYVISCVVKWCVLQVCWNCISELKWEYVMFCVSSVTLGCNFWRLFIYQFHLLCIPYSACNNIGFLFISRMQLCFLKS